VDPQLGAGLHLVADVDLGRGVVADQNDSEARRTPQRRYPRLTFIQNRVADKGAVENLCHHYEGNIRVGRAAPTEWS